MTNLVLRVLPVVLLAACGVTTIDEYELCSLDAAVAPPAALPGATVSVTGGPYTEVRDTRVDVGGVPAEVLDVTRNESCAECDTCRREARCPPCGVCTGDLITDASRRAACFGDGVIAGVCSACVETMSFVVPEGVAGQTSVWIVNRAGTSGQVPFEVLGGVAPDTGETGATTGGTGASTGDTGGPPTGGTGTTGDTAAPTGTGDTAIPVGPGGTGSTGGTGS